MKITIHRGTHQIGGCVTEYEYGGWRLFVDYGEELPGGPKTGDLRVEGLTHGDISKSALLITHYHGDHIGCITKLPKDLPIYMGKVGREILLELSNHLKTVSEVHHEMVERLQTVSPFNPGYPIDEFGNFKIMPITVDHSAFDAYAFKIEAGGVSAFHTGDFRTHGFRSSALPEVIKKFVGSVDYVVCEATNISRPAATNQSEQELQKEYIKLFTKNKYNVVYVSSTNVDRLFGLYHAAINTNKVFIIDGYQKKIMDVVAERDPIWGRSKLYKFKESREPMILSTSKGSFWMNDKFSNLIQDKGFVMIARSNTRFDSFIASIPGKKQTYLSMWDGYVREGSDTYSENLARSLGKGFLYMHTSGHCDMKSLRDFFRLLHPKAIIPIHTDNPKEFSQLFSDEWPVLLLNDGDSISLA
jgi:ribonuclease J